jgi:[protein-PII] uridylyltransferase
VHSASVNSHDGTAINTFVVSPHFGAPPAAQLLREQFSLALAGDLDVIAALERRDADAAATNPRRAGEIPDAVPITSPPPPRILWFDGTSPGEFVVQIRSTDRPGLLARLTAVVERDGIDIAWAKVTTLGSSVVDAFGVVVPALIGDPASDTAAFQRDLERDLLAVLPAPGSVGPVAEAGAATGG